MSEVYRFNEIKAEPIERFQSGFVFLDICYGKSEINGIEEYGLPKGKISIWGGSGGVGKSRTAIEIALSLNSQGYRVLFVQNEVTPSEFKGWIEKTVHDESNFLISTQGNLISQIESINKYRPDIVIVDSVNMIKGFKNPTELRHIMDVYRKTTNDCGCHVLFISHLNKAGELKGNNDLGYLGDIICTLEPLSSKLSKNELNNITDFDKYFILTIGKNRHGSSGGIVEFKHTDKGIEYIDSSEQQLLIQGQRDYKFMKNEAGDLEYVPKSKRPNYDGIIIPRELIRENEPNEESISIFARLAGCSTDEMKKEMQKIRRNKHQGERQVPEKPQPTKKIQSENGILDSIANWALGKG